MDQVPRACGLEDRQVDKDFTTTPNGNALVAPAQITDSASTQKVKATIIAYGDSYCEEAEVRDKECQLVKEDATVTWIDVDEMRQTALLEQLAKRYGLHPLVVEDILSPSQRPKIDDYGNYLYIVLRMFYRDPRQDEIHFEQVSIVLGEGFVLSFQEGERDVFDPIRQRIRMNGGRIRKTKADYLAYSLIDAIVDSYFAILETISDKVDELEEELVSNPKPEKLEQMHSLKRDMITLRSSVWPLREVIGRLQRGESPLIHDPTRIYLRDVYDHTVQVIETIETYRDILSGMLDIYLSSVSNRLNEVMKVLTVISTVFMPLTFITGFYGMNFRYMPLWEWHSGYLILFIIMLAIAGVMVLYFRSRKWF